jgi:hypothetical protein
MQHLANSPHDVNSGDVDCLVLHALRAGEYTYSDKQLEWVLDIARSVEADPQRVALLLALARRGGPDLAVPDIFAHVDEVIGEAKAIYDECVASALRVVGGMQ